MQDSSPRTNLDPTPDLAAIRARVEAATPGEWRAYDHGGGAIVSSAAGPVTWLSLREGADEGEIPALADAEFVAHARTDVPALLSALEVAVSRAEVAETALARVEGLHPRLEWYAGVRCSRCHTSWPCSTVVALRGDAT